MVCALFSFVKYVKLIYSNPDPAYIYVPSGGAGGLFCQDDQHPSHHLRHYPCTACIAEKYHKTALEPDLFCLYCLSTVLYNAKLIIALFLPES